MNFLVNRLDELSDMEITARCCLCKTTLNKKIMFQSLFLSGIGYICPKCNRILHDAITSKSKTNYHNIIPEDKSYDDEKEDKEIFINEDEKILSPKMMYDKMSEFICGQDKAKKLLCTAIYGHLKKSALNNKYVDKSNVLLIGKTGTGKTYAVSKLAELFDLPLITISATSLTENGWEGENVEDCISKLLNKCNGDVNRTEKGIVFIDEIDKIAGFAGPSSKQVIGKTGVQQALLKIIEGTIVQVDYNKNGVLSRKISINTKDILFICAGAFDGIEDIIEKRTNKKIIGFNSSNDFSKMSVSDNIIENIQSKDLIDYGMIPELLGRLPLLITFDNITKDALKNIITKPKGNILWQYKELLKSDDIIINFDDDVIEYIVDCAFRDKCGCRSVRKICENIMSDIIFELPGFFKGEITINYEYICKRDLELIKVRDIEQRKDID